MAGSSGGILREIRKLIKHSSCGSPPDRELLERFCQHHDEAAFTDLVRRHGTLVLGVCRRMLRQTQDVEDAFQATFLLLAQKASSVRKQESVASWLHGVAQRVATNAKIATERRRRRERLAALSDFQEARDHVTWQEVRTVLHEELGRLPEHYRAPLLLCYLEGMTQEDAARQLGWTPATVSNRLYRGRDLLRRRLTRRGLSLGAGILATVLSEPCASASMAMLRKATVKGVLRYTLGKAGRTLSVEVVALAQESVPMMASVKTRLGIAAFLVLTMIATGAGLLAHQPVVNSGDKNQADKSSPAQQIHDERQQPRLDLFGDPLPPDAIARLGTVRFRHGANVSCIALAPDGKLLASGGFDNVIRVWEMESGKEVRRCAGHTDFPDCVVFSPDGKSLASAGLDKTIRIWDAKTGRNLHQLRCKGTVYSIAFSPDGATLASASDGKVRLWNPATGEERGTLQGDKGGVATLAFSPDGKQLASGHSEGKTVCLWEIATGREVCRFNASRKDQKGGTVTVAFSPNGKALVAGSDGLIHWWDLVTGKEVKQFAGPKETLGRQCLVFTSDGKTLISGTSDGVIRAWDVDTAKESRVLGKQGDIVYNMALSTSGRVLATCGGYVMRLWDIKDAKEICLADGHRHGVGSVRLSADGRTAVSVAIDGTIRKWDTARGNRLDHIDTGHWASPSVALSSDARVAALCQGDFLPKGDDVVRLWNVDTSKQLPSPKMVESGVRLALSKSGQMLVTAGVINELPQRPTLRLWDATTGKGLRELEGLVSYGHCLAISADDTVLAVADGVVHNQGLRNLIHLYDASGKELRQISDTSNVAEALAFSPDGRTLAACVPETSHPNPRRSKWVLILWEVATGQKRVSMVEEGINLNGGFNSDWLVFSPYGATLAYSCLDNTIRLREVATGRELHRLEGHRGRVTSLSFSGNGKRLASGSWDTSILIWDLKKSAPDMSHGSVRLSSKELEALWTDLAGNDAARAYQSQLRLVTSPKETLTFLKARVRPAEVVAPVDEKRFEQLLADLDADDFATRQKAAEDLAKAGTASESTLRKALEGRLSLEVRRQVERLLERLHTLSPERLQVLRALEVLENIDTPGSRQLLEKLATGPADTWLTKEAKAVTKRLASRDEK